MKEKFLKAGLFSAVIFQNYQQKSIQMGAELVTIDYNLVAMIAKQC